MRATAAAVGRCREAVPTKRGWSGIREWSKRHDGDGRRGAERLGQASQAVLDPAASAPRGPWPAKRRISTRCSAICSTMLACGRGRRFWSGPEPPERRSTSPSRTTARACRPSRPPTWSSLGTNSTRMPRLRLRTADHARAGRIVRGRLDPRPVRPRRPQGDGDASLVRHFPQPSPTLRMVVQRILAASEPQQLTEAHSSRNLCKCGALLMSPA